VKSCVGERRKSQGHAYLRVGGLNVTALETLRLEVDPVTGKLKYVGHLAL
jgi:hypothetical protein